MSALDAPGGINLPSTAQHLYVGLAHAGSFVEFVEPPPLMVVLRLVLPCARGSRILRMPRQNTMVVLPVLLLLGPLHSCNI